MREKNLSQRGQERKKERKRKTEIETARMQESKKDKQTK